MTEAGVAEERQVELVATGWELIEGDVVELEAYARLSGILVEMESALSAGRVEEALTGLAGGRRILGRLRAHDVAENRRHRHMVKVAGGAVS
jgi:hypothetical protein